MSERENIIEDPEVDAGEAATGASQQAEAAPDGAADDVPDHAELTALLEETLRFAQGDRAEGFFSRLSPV